jgi:nucleotide-binding universal stress UspA family protein
MDCAKILVLVDGRRPSNSAVDAAAALACAHRAGVAVLRIRRRLASDQVVGAAVHRLRQSGIPSTGAVVVAERGEEAAAVAQYAAAVGADLVVVGSRGLGRIPAALLGSFSQRIAAELDLPLVIVRAQPPDLDLDSWLVGIADRCESRKLLETVSELKPGARVHVVAVASVGVEDPSNLVREAVEAARDIGLLASGQVVSGPDVAASLLRAAEDHQCGAVILGSRRPGPLEALLRGSVAQDLLHEGTVPVVLAGRS